MDFTPYRSSSDARLSTSSSDSNSNRSDYSSASDCDSVWSSSTVIRVNEEKLYVAVDKKFEEGKSVLSWALQNSGGRKICLLHVHQPAQVAQDFGMMGGISAATLLKEQAEGRKKMLRLLNKYLLFCSRAGVQKLQIETNFIEEGIVKLILQYEIRWLVMGAASKKHYSRNMTDLKSKKAKYVNAQAPATCHIWFVCKDQLIYERQGSFGLTNVDPVPEVQQPGPNPGTIRPDPVIARSVTLGPSTQRNQISSTHYHYRTISVNLDVRRGLGGASTSNSARQSEASLEKNSGTSMIHLSQASHLPTCSSSDVDSSIALTPNVNSWGSQDELQIELDDARQIISKYKKERDELQIERDNALQIAEDLRRKQAKSSSTNFPQFFSEFSFLEIEKATRCFDPSLKIVEGDHGTIYKGLLRHTEVAIKMLNTESLQAPSEYQREVDVLSKSRHPNIVTLIGACPDFFTLIYEYLPNGSLEDRLNCKDNSPPLTWKTRIHIATELCSALAFLHSSKPHSIVHGDLKPSNILLDANFVSKLSNFGICRVLSLDEHAIIEATTSYRAYPQNTFAFTDPEPFLSGELTMISDVYSFGVVLLRLLTGKASVGITKEVRNALDGGKIDSVLDNLAGGWPYVLAEQLAHLALRCVEYRPDLGSEVLTVLQAIRASCGGFTSSARTNSEDSFQAPHYFVSPIFQEVMQEPHVAADVFTRRH